MWAEKQKKHSKGVVSYMPVCTKKKKQNCWNLQETTNFSLTNHSEVNTDCAVWWLLENDTICLKIDYKPHIHYAFHLPPGWILFSEKQNLNVDFLWKLSTAKEKSPLLMEEAKRAKRESDRNWGKTRANKHSLDGERSGAVSKSVPLLMCFLQTPWLQMLKN